MLFVLFVLAPCFALGCRSETPRASTCPAGFRADDARAEGILAKLGDVPAGARARDQALAKGGISFCFGRIGVSSVTTSGAVLIDEALGTEEAAARVGHLLTHVAEGLRVEPRGGEDESCEVITERALAAEAAALSLELGLRRALGVGSSARVRYEFEGGYWAAPEKAREGLVLDYLRAHPDGAPGIDALASGYARRCREARGAASAR
ncbi:hypothetical protein [Polyangium mundeleinium]|uniref:Lipoprotein n=1 Tax=Polyangium mundeleinium TaxID=2995306 RepID=A0ABT5EJ08_9BACT|nr:hypothetical protein [Polyangium mundeleinium]MDC0741803.1 hypothetical protein [Polyangium mundeleinium]